MALTRGLSSDRRRAVVQMNQAQRLVVVRQGIEVVAGLDPSAGP